MGIIGGEKSVITLRQALLNPNGSCAVDGVLDTIVEALGKIGKAKSGVDFLPALLPWDSAIEAIK